MPQEDYFADEPLQRTAAASDPNWSKSMYNRNQKTGQVLPISGNSGGYRHRRVSRRRIVSRRRVSRRRVSRRHRK